MNGIEIILGLVQGLTEFLPVSSSGHLFLMEKFLKGEKLSLSFVLLLHLATFFSIAIVFFKEIKAFVLGLAHPSQRDLLLKVLISLSPLLFVGLFLREFIEQSFEKNIVGFGFLCSGLLIFSLLFIPKKSRSLEEMSFLQVFLIGLAQSLAVLPGFSRSAWTISVGLYCGLSPRQAVYFSFLISLPAIMGSVLFDIFFSASFSAEAFQWNLSLIPAFFTAFLSGLLSLLLVLKMVQNSYFYIFSFYLLPLAFVCFFFL